MINRVLLEEQLRELPIVQYEFFETASLTFSSRVSGGLSATTWPEISWVSVSRPKSRTAR